MDEAWLELLSKLKEDDVNSYDANDDEMNIPQAMFNEWFAKSVFFEDRQKAVQLRREEVDSSLHGPRLAGETALYCINAASHSHLLHYPRRKQSSLREILSCHLLHGGHLDCCLCV